MPRARREPLIVGCLVLAVTAGNAGAFHVGTKFDEPPGAGGAGGLFYTGSSRDRGWDCAACHIEPRGTLVLRVTSQPPELLAEQTYQPGAAYVITIAMTDPAGQLGLAATRSNFNGMAISTLDEAGAPTGVFSGFDPGRFSARGTSFLASSSPVVNETSWSMTWTAPTTGVPIAIDLGVVDGNGAGQTSQTTLTDPLGDDAAMAHFLVVAATAPRARDATPWVHAVFDAMIRACRSRSSALASSG